MVGSPRKLLRSQRGPSHARQAEVGFAASGDALPQPLGSMGEQKNQKP